MRQSTASPASAGNPAAPTTAETRLSGLGLLIGRVGWITLTLLILTLSAIALSKADALLQSVCQPGAPCLISIQLTQANLRQLQQLGLSPGFLATYQLGLDVGTLLIYTTLAALIFWRRPTERMALFCAYTLVLTGGATYTGLLDEGLRPLASAWYWPVGVLDWLGLTSLLIFFLLFPSGRFVPRWTRWGIFVIALAEAHYVFLTDRLQAATESGPPVDFLALVVLVLGLVGLQVYRYRHVSTFRERQQTKWIVFGCSVALVGFIVAFTLVHFFPDQTVQSPIFQTLVTNTLSSGFLLFIPICIAIAILRSRLWDIDILINKALVYGLLTGILGGLYAGLILGLESLAGLIAGSASTNPVVLVVSTLVIAALVLPAQRRIQSLIDRRFYRKKYDAEQMLTAFNATLRNQVDLEQIRDRMLSVVQETMQPAHVSLWLRQPERRSTDQAHHLERPDQATTTPSLD